MKPLHYFSVVLITLVGFISIMGFTITSEDEPILSNKNIIKFSHEFHSEVSECADCHTSVKDAVTLSDRLLPDKPACAACHDVEDDENCTLCHYEDTYEPLMQPTSSNLYFNHQQHVTTLGMECTACHKGLNEVDYSFEAMGVNPPMDNCYSCHNNKSAAANHCETCHTTTADLYPADHKTASFMEQHKFTASAENQNCAMCHDTQDFCEACHVSTSMIDENNTLTDFYTPYSPHQYKSDSKQMQITRVHGLDYRFSHGIEARSKTMECTTCHQTETFCAECHNSDGGDFASDGFLPSSHLVNNFLTIGAGTGGGEHAIQAKRDIESCAACHDTQGADPSCILCHTDNDGIKGTNPRTHVSGFMNDRENGDWHEDMGSVCYNCHMDVNARPSGTAGIGFCGYCHGSK